ncbi:hypothetical protein AMR41_13185 [Hapalosiphon sp. MRB220]|nr:hypothetical protein AMR41_13185 [Hapalosiphon sp. MRB220]
MSANFGNATPSVQLLYKSQDQNPDFLQKVGVLYTFTGSGSIFSLANFFHCLSDRFGVFTIKGLLIAIIPGNKTDKSPRPL